MTPLTRLSVPLTAVSALRPDLFPGPRFFVIAVFAIVPGFDTFFSVPGLFHSPLVTLPISVGMVLVGRRYRTLYGYAVRAVRLLHSLLLQDVRNGRPVTFLYPFVRGGIGLTYPTRLGFGEGPGGVVVRHPLASLRFDPTSPGRTTYPLINGYGMLSALPSVTISPGRQIEHRMGGEHA